VRGLLFARRKLARLGSFGSGQWSELGSGIVVDGDGSEAGCRALISLQRRSSRLGTVGRTCGSGAIGILDLKCKQKHTKVSNPRHTLIAPAAFFFGLTSGSFSFGGTISLSQTIQYESKVSSRDKSCIESAMMCD
jgi:hypothetical protein